MSQPTTYLTSVSRYRRPSGSPRQRVLAALLAAMLALGGLLPGAAYAGQADSEAEGGAPPESVAEPGEAAEFDPGGEETTLEELPAAAGAQFGGDAEDTGEGEPVEAEPVQDTEAPAPTEVTAAAPEEDGSAETEEASSPARAAPEAVVAPEPQSTPAPEYATAPPPATPVENQPLVAPSPPPQGEPEAREESPAVVVSTEPPPPMPPPSEQPPPPRPVATAVDREEGGQSLAGRDSHTVRPGECLWSIAGALLPAGAGNDEIAQEVQRLWRLNASRIATGDPDMLPVGVELRLP